MQRPTVGSDGSKDSSRNVRCRASGRLSALLLWSAERPRRKVKRCRWYGKARDPSRHCTETQRESVNGWRSATGRRRVPAMTQEGDGARQTVGGVTANNGDRRCDENAVYVYQAGEFSVARSKRVWRAGVTVTTHDGAKGHVSRFDTNRAPCSLQSACTSASAGC